MSVRLALLCLMLALAGPARAEKLITTLSTSRVLIASNYTGSELVLFGAIERDGATVPRAGNYDIVVTARGPRSTVTVREKDRAGLIYLNQDRRKFADVPAYLAVLSSRPLKMIAGDPFREKLKLGLDAIIRGSDAPLSINAEFEAFSDALIRLKKDDGLFRENSRGVTFLSPNLFRAVIEMPAIAPLGPYEVEARLFADGVPLTVTTSPFEVSKVGFEAVVAQAARTRPWLYGFATVFMALFSGWLASVAFRRD